MVSLFEKAPGQRRVLHGEALKAQGLDHPRAGDVVLMAEPDNWYTYYFCVEDSRAPDFARCVDIHRKPGYDPCELFFDPARPAKALAAMALLRKKLGFRYYLDVIPLDASLVKGSHGTPMDQDADAPLLMGDKSAVGENAVLPMTAVRDVILRAVG